jgi:hypothetical protein
MTGRKPIDKTYALVSLKHCELSPGFVADLQDKNESIALQRVELPTCPLSATTRKACLDGNELVPGFLSGKVGLLILEKNND